MGSVDERKIAKSLVNVGCKLVCLRQVRISDHHLQGLLAQELLECPDVDARHYAATGECMPQIVSMEIRNLRCLDDLIPPKAGLLQR